MGTTGGHLTGTGVGVGLTGAGGHLTGTGAGLTGAGGHLIGAGLTGAHLGENMKQEKADEIKRATARVLSMIYEKI